MEPTVVELIDSLPPAERRQIQTVGKLLYKSGGGCGACWIYSVHMNDQSVKVTERVHKDHPELVAESGVNNLIRYYDGVGHVLYTELRTGPTVVELLDSLPPEVRKKIRHIGQPAMIHADTWAYPVYMDGQPDETTERVYKDLPTLNRTEANNLLLFHDDDQSIIRYSVAK